MVKKMFSVVLVLLSVFTAKAQYQFPNSTFDADFIGSYGSYTEPEGWHGYASIDASPLNSFGRKGDKLVASADVREGATGKCIYIKSSEILSVIANGVMTNGQIYTYNTDPTDGTKNYNFSESTNTGNTSTYGENNKFFTEFIGRPDSMRVWLRFVPKNSSNGNARVSVYTHLPNTKMYDPTDNADMSIVVAHAEQSVPECDWTCYSLPFSYSSTADPGLILATFTTNETPGKGGNGDLLYIDDIEMVYLSTLLSCTYNEETVNFVDGNATVHAVYNAQLLAYALAGAGATAEVTEPTKDNGYVLTILVKGNNISEDASNVHAYTIQFDKSSDENDNENGEDNNNGDVEETPISVPTPAASALADARFYFYSVAQGGYLTTGDQLSDEPELYYTINQSAGTIMNQNGGYFTLDRLSYSSSLDYSKFVVYSDNETAYDVLTFTQTEDNSLRLYRKNLKYYDNGWGTKRNADIYLGASGMTTLLACSATDDNGLWQLIDPADYLVNYMNAYAAKAGSQNAISRDLTVLNDRETTVLNGLPVGLYSIDGGEKFYLAADAALTLTAANTSLSYYGDVDLSLDATYNGVTLSDGMTIEELYDAEKVSVSLSGNGQQTYSLSFDENTYQLTITLSGYGSEKAYTIQFAAPDLSLFATWYGEEVTDGMSIDEVYDAAALTVTPAEGANAEVHYDSTTGEATITLSNAIDSRTYTLHFATLPATVSTLRFAPINAQKNGVEVTDADEMAFVVETLENDNLSFTFASLPVLSSVTATNLTLDEDGRFCYAGELRAKGNGNFVPVVINGQFRENNLVASADVRLDETTLMHACYGIQTTESETFTDSLVVIINSDSVAMDDRKVIVSTIDNSHINFTLRDFAMELEGTTAYIGNINLEYLTIDEEGNFTFNGSILIGPGSDSEKEWGGLSLGIVPISMTGQLYTSHDTNALYVTIDIDMQESLGQTIRVIFGREKQEEIVDGVQHISVIPTASDVLYDLNGRRVQQAGKGIYISNGKKVLR